MTTTAHEDQFTVAPEPVRQPYDTGSILRRNVADLELALRTQTERAEAAEEELLAVREDNHSMMLEIDGLRKELAKLREQAPAGWVDADGDFYHGRNYPNVFPTAVPVYAAPQAPAVPELDPMTRLIVSDPKQLKPKKQEPAVPDGMTMVSAGDANNYCRILTLLGMEEEGDPVKAISALLQSAEVQAGDKWQLTPAPTHPADRNAGEVRHD